MHLWKDKPNSPSSKIQFLALHLTSDTKTQKDTKTKKNSKGLIIYFILMYMYNNI